MTVITHETQTFEQKILVSSVGAAILVLTLLASYYTTYFIYRSYLAEAKQYSATIKLAKSGAGQEKEVIAR